MTNLGKVLLGVGVVGAVAVTAYVMNKVDEKEEPKQDNDILDEEELEEETSEKKDETVLTKVKKKVLRAAIKGVVWVAEHQEQIEAIGTLIGLAAGIFNVVSAVKDFKAGNKMQDQVDELVREKNVFKEAWNGTVRANEADMDTLMDRLDDLEALIAPKKVRKTA